MTTATSTPAKERLVKRLTPRVRWSELDPDEITIRFEDDSGLDLVSVDWRKRYGAPHEARIGWYSGSSSGPAQENLDSASAVAEALGQALWIAQYLRDGRTNVTLLRQMYSGQE